jgi:hypothetical protein
VIALLAIAAALVPAGAADTRVHPSVEPSQPTQWQRVVIRFRARESVDGVYSVEARTREPGCEARRSRAVRAPRRGRVVRLTLSRGWCVGAYRATVFFKQTVRCHPSIQCGDSAEVRRGSVTFTVVPGR